MTDHRDLSDGAVDRLARGLHTPDHGPDFWVELDQTLHTTVAAHHRGADTTFEGTAMTTPDRPSFFTARRPAPWLVGAAASIVVLIAGLLIWGGRADDNTTLDTAEETELPDTPAPDGDADATDDGSHESGDDTDGGDTDGGDAGTEVFETGASGEGRPLAVDPTSSYLYLAVPDPTTNGCEGGPGGELAAQSIGGEGTVQVLALPGFDASGGVHLAFGPDDRIAVQSFCEGFGAEIVAGTIGPDGTIVDTTTIEVPFLLDDGTSGGGPDTVDWVVDLAWVDADTLAVATQTTFGEDIGDYGETIIVPVTPTEGRPEAHNQPDARGAIALEMSPVGLVALNDAGEVTVDGTLVTTLAGATELTLSPDGATIAVFGPTGLVTVGTDGTDVRQRLQDPVHAASLAGGLIALQGSDGRGTVISLGAELVIETDGTYEMAAAPDASRVFVGTSLGTAGSSGFTEVLLGDA